MDIKERIDGLSEAEAKAALAWVIELFGRSFSCKRCPVLDCPSQIVCIDMCEKFILDEALKGARE